MDLFENAVFMLSFGRVKTELFENADVKASIYDVSEHAHGFLGIKQGHFDCLFSFVKVRTEEFEWSVFVWTGIFWKTLLVWTRIFLKTDKKDAFSKISGYVWTRPKLKPNLCNCLKTDIIESMAHPQQLHKRGTIFWDSLNAVWKCYL